MVDKWHGGKGSRRRNKADDDSYRSNYDRIFNDPDKFPFGADVMSGNWPDGNTKEKNQYGSNYDFIFNGGNRFNMTDDNAYDQAEEYLRSLNDPYIDKQIRDLDGFSVIHLANSQYRKNMDKS